MSKPHKRFEPPFGPKAVDNFGCHAAAMAMGLNSLGGNYTPAALDKVMERASYRLPDMGAIGVLSLWILGQGYRLVSIYPKRPEPLKAQPDRKDYQTYCHEYKTVLGKNCPTTWEEFNEAHYARLARADKFRRYEQRGRLVSRVAPITGKLLLEYLRQQKPIVATTQNRDGFHSVTLLPASDDPRESACYEFYPRAEHPQKAVLFEAEAYAKGIVQHSGLLVISK